MPNALTTKIIGGAAFGVVAALALSAWPLNMETLAMSATENADPALAIASPVDLGLSVRWASFNLGAERPEDYGGLYGWADPTGKKRSTDNSDYPSDDPPREISGTELDIAHVVWGSGWRLPTRAEQQELVDDAVWRKTTQNGVAGYSVTGPNGNSIFMPAVGGRVGERISYQVDGADYWSGTRSDDPNSAYYLYYYIGEDPTLGSLPRHYGFAVRAVVE